VAENNQANIHQLKPHYRSGRASLAADFFSPCLQACSQYRRAAGYFSSSALVTWAAALPRLALSAEITFKVIASPQLSPDDVSVLNAIADPVQRRHYEDMLIERILEDVIRMAESPSDARLRARVFAWLLVNQRMTIRFAFADHVHDAGIFHEKIGIFDFPWGDVVAFTGSANETISGHERNYESIDVYRSWVPGEDDRVKTKVEQFEEAWNNRAFGLSVREPNKEVLARLRAVAPDDAPSFIGPLPPVEKPREDARWRHQDEAVDIFLQKRAGILEMATGTGKTRTALKILKKLIDSREIDAAVIATDGSDLLSQWADEVDAWVAACALPYVTYRHFSKFHELGNFVLDPTNAVLVVSREQLSRVFARLPASVRARMIIVHDEVHGLGTPSMRRTLVGQHQQFGYRLGLSATPERAYDDEGNKFIEDEIGPTIFSFPLEKAIERGVLCEFDYIPLEYHLTEDDRERLKQVFSRQAARAHSGSPMSDEELWIELSRVYKTAEMKPFVFSQYLHRDATVLENAIIFVETKEYGARLLEIIHGYTHLYRTYYAEDERDHLIEFSRGAIACLVTCHKISQGIDIRLLRTVILFSAARAKLETIQRIGRCLRVDPTNPDKRARVIDFVRPEDDEDDERYLNADQERKEWLQRLSQSRRKTDDVS
jgi:superfamily II DNA or RNA helicase